jgi:hypothetical protein
MPISDDLISDDLVSDDLINDDLVSDDLVSDDPIRDDLVSDPIAVTHWLGLRLARSSGAAQVLWCGTRMRTLGPWLGEVEGMTERVKVITDMESLIRSLPMNSSLIRSLLIRLSLIRSSLIRSSTIRLQKEADNPKGR